MAISTLTNNIVQKLRTFYSQFTRRNHLSNINNFNGTKSTCFVIDASPNNAKGPPVKQNISL